MASPDKFGVPLLTGAENYIYWSVKIQAWLERENAIGLDGSFSALSSAQNKKALISIKLMCGEGPVMFIKDVNMASEAWDILKSHYKPTSFTSQYILCKEFFNTILEDFDTIEAYINKIKLLLENLKTNDISLLKQVIISWILNSLDDEYSGFIQNITQSLRQDSEAYSVDILFSSLLDESRGKIYKSSEKALVIRRKNNPERGKTTTICSNCKLRGHKREDCFFLFPDKAPNSWKIRKQKKEKSSKNSSFKNLSREKRNQLQEKLLAAFASNNSSESELESPDEKVVNTTIDSEKEYSENLVDLSDISFNSTMDIEVNNLYIPFIYTTIANKTYLGNREHLNSIEIAIDTAANIVSFSDIRLFSTIRTTNRDVKWGQASTIHVNKTGDSIIKFSDTQILYRLRNIYYIPSLGLNILGYKTISKHIRLELEGNLLYLYSRKINKLITKGFQKEGLYYIRVYIQKENKPKVYISQKYNKQRDEAYKWHCRLGHINPQALDKFFKNHNLSIPLNKSIKDFIYKCDICLKSKYITNINKESRNTQTFNILERVHSDIGGPLKLSYDKYRYYILFLNKYLRYLEVYLL